MLSENDKEQIQELLLMTHDDIQVFNLDYIYQKVESLFNKEIFEDYVNYLKHNPDVDGLDNDELIDFEYELTTILMANIDIEVEFNEAEDVIDALRYWLRYRNEVVNLS